MDEERDKRFKLLCEAVLDDDYSRETLKGFAISYLVIINNLKNKQL